MVIPQNEHVGRVARERAQSDERTHRRIVSRSLGHCESRDKGEMNLCCFTFSPLRVLFPCKGKTEGTSGALRRNYGPAFRPSTGSYFKDIPEKHVPLCSHRFLRYFTNLPRNILYLYPTPPLMIFHCYWRLPGYFPSLCPLSVRVRNRCCCFHNNRC